MAFKRWVLPKENKELAKVVAAECNTNEFVASILVNRGKSSSNDAMQFLGSDMEIASPYELADIENAVTRIREAIDSGEKIAVYGDYDCDGITSVAILYSYLCSVGADVIYYIPEREGDGYGLCNAAIDELKAKGVGLIITVDNGITAVDEVLYAINQCIDVVITDHHQPTDRLPEAVAIVNPHRRDDTSGFKDLCGAGVVFKLLIALEEDLAYVLENYADLVMIGTIGDIVPLVGENRAIVKYGIDMLPVSENVGLKALLEVSKVNVNTITAQDIAFSIVPRINAAGRMGNALLALELLLCEDEEAAVALATQLNDMNVSRKQSEIDILAVVDKMLLEDRSILNQRVLILCSEQFSHGLVGVVCSRLIEKYGKPVMLLCPDGDELRGSARSIGEFHLFKVLNANEKLLTRFGGHKYAGGFSLKKDKLEQFKSAIEQYACENFDIMPVSSVSIDKVVVASELVIENIEELDRLKPYGNLNEEPKFMLANVAIEEIKPIGGGKHLKLRLGSDGKSVPALLFGVTEQEFLYKINQRVDVLITAEINTYNNKKSVSVKIKEIRPIQLNAVQQKLFSAKGYYEKLIKGEDVDKNILDRSIPTRNEIALIHKLLIQNNGFIGDIEDLFVKVLQANINYCKLRIIVDILEEFKLLSLTRPEGGIVLGEIKQKIDLNDASLIKRLGVTFV